MDLLHAILASLKKGVVQIFNYQVALMHHWSGSAVTCFVQKPSLEQEEISGSWSN